MNKTKYMDKSKPAFSFEQKKLRSSRLHRDGRSPLPALVEAVQHCAYREPLREDAAAEKHLPRHDRVGVAGSQREHCAHEHDRGRHQSYCSL
jgi:hypothetical protein